MSAFIRLLPALGILLAGCATTATRHATLERSSNLELPFESPPEGWTFEIRTGEPRATVLSLWGRPDSTLGPDLWVYRRAFSANRDAKGFDTLVITFTSDRVSQLRLVNGATLQAYLDNLPRVHPAEASIGPRRD